MTEPQPLPPLGQILESIFRDAPEYFVVLDPELRVKIAGETFRRTVGFEPDKHVSFLDTIERFSLSKAREVFEALRQGDGEHRRLDIFHHRTDGEAVSVTYSWVACMDEAGTCRAFVGIGRESAAEAAPSSGEEVSRLRAALERASQDTDRRAKEIARLREQIESQASRDELTGLLNRRAVLERAEGEVARAIRYDEPLTLLLFDIDHMTLVNEEYGQEKGDEVIRRVAETVGDQTRTSDLAARYEGEAFLVLCPHTDRANAQFLAERLRRRVAELSFESDAGEFGVTISVGLVTVAGGNEFDMEAILHAAESAVESAKNGGMNRVKLMDVS